MDEIMGLMLAGLIFLNPCLPEIDILPCGFSVAAEIASEGRKVDCTYVNDTRKARVVYQEGKFVGVTFKPILADKSYLYMIDTDQFFFNDFRVGILDREISKKEACEGIVSDGRKEMNDGERNISGRDTSIND
jgi:hypothetical protein